MELSMWILMLVCDLILPLALIGLGQKFTKDPPKTIDPMYGYRTVRSMKSQDAWTFAQACYGRVCCQTGGALLVPTVLFQLLMWTLRVSVTSISYCFWHIGFVALAAFASVAAMYFRVERTLKKEFDQNGVRRHG